MVPALPPLCPATPCPPPALLYSFQWSPVPRVTLAPTPYPHTSSPPTHLSGGVVQLPVVAGAPGQAALKHDAVPKPAGGEDLDGACM